MKIAIVGIANNLANIDEQIKITEFIKLNMIKQGKLPSLVSYFENTYNNVNYVLSMNFDYVIFVGTDNIIYNYGIIENISRALQIKLIKDSTCENSIKSYCKLNQQEFTQQEEMLTFFPEMAQPIYTKEFLSNGFKLKYNNTTLLFLSGNYKFVKNIFYDNFFELFDNNFSFNHITLRCYGIQEKDIRNIISIELNNPSTTISILNNRLDSIIQIEYSINNENTAQTIIADVCQKLSHFIYSTEDTNIYQTAINLLELQNKRIVICETVTSGNVILNLNKLNPKIVEKSLIFNSFDSLAKHFKLDEKIVNQYGQYSVNTAYELDNLLLQQANSDIAVFILGNNAHNECYIAIGDIDGIHIYKNKLLSSDENFETISETTMFYLIKKLRQNDLQFK